MSRNALLLLFLALLLTSCGGAQKPRSKWMFANYPGFAFSGNGQIFDMFWCGQGGVPDLYLKAADGQVHRLRELDEPTVLKWLEYQPSEALRKRAVSQGEYESVEATFYNFPGHSILIFCGGRLRAGNFCNAERGPFAGASLATSPDGEFVTLPVAIEDMQRVFGEPKLSESKRHGS